MSNFPYVGYAFPFVSFAHENLETQISMKKRDSKPGNSVPQSEGNNEGHSAFWPEQLPSSGEAQENVWRSSIFMLAAVMVLIAGTLVSYLPAFQADFLPFDDQQYVYMNSNVAEGISWDSTIWAFTRVSVANWHPLTWLSHMIDVELFGLDPHGHHASSIVWHVANVVLLFAVLKYLTGQALPSFCLAALFALHPTHVEVVGWVAQRKTLISTFFILLTIAAYARYVRQRSWKWYAISLFAFAMSLMSKQTFVTLPALLVLLDYWPLRRGLHVGTTSWYELVRISIRQAPDKLAFATLSVLAAVLTVASQTEATQSLDSFPVAYRMGNICIAYCRYLAGLFWPANLSIYYTINLASITPPIVLGAIAILGGLSAIVLYVGRIRSYLVTGWFWFLISMLPVIGIVHVGSQSMADRYLYNSSFGIFLCLVWLWQDLMGAASQSLKLGGYRRRIIRAGTTTLCLIVAAALAIATFRRCQRWQTVLGTFQEAIDQNPNNWMIHFVMAEHYIALKNYEEGIKHAKAALQQSEDSDFYLLQAIACRELDRPKEAIELLHKAIELEPDFALAYSLLAVIHSELDQKHLPEQMLRLAEETLRLPVNQKSPRIRSLTLRNCGIALLNLDRIDEAIERFEDARKWDSLDTSLIHQLAQAELSGNRAERAIERLEELDLKNPNESFNKLALGRAYKQIGKRKEAESNLRKSLELQKLEPQACLQLADILLHSGRIDEAEKLLRDCLDNLHLGNVTKETLAWNGELNSQLGDVLLAKKDLSGAIGHYQTAIESAPDQFSANNNLAWLLATEPDPAIRNPEEAVRLAEHANSLPGAQDQGSLGTLAAAYAAAGRMEEAIQIAEQALARAEAKGDAASVTQLRTQLELHRQGKPLIESVLKPGSN